MTEEVNYNASARLYNDRFRIHGRNIRTVGWGSSKDQYLRFDILFRNLSPRGKTILDVGCGLGDLIPYLRLHCGSDFRYIGIDIAELLLLDAVDRYAGEYIEFIHGDIFSVELPQVDIAILSGALSHRVSGIEDYARNTLSRMYKISNEAACLNFLSTYVDYTLEKNQHYNPEEVFRWARKESLFVSLYHDYPLHEFTVQLRRNGSDAWK